MDTEKLKKRRPGGRSQKVQEAVFAAAEEILLREGHAGFRIADVAQKAGVNETSIYRRWGTKEALVLEMLSQRVEQATPNLNTGSLRTGLLAILYDMIAAAHTPLGQALIEISVLCMMRPELAPYRAVYWERRLALLGVVFEQAVARGEIPANHDPTFLLELLFGPVLSRLLVTGEPLTADFAERVVDQLLSSVLVTDAKKPGEI